MLIAPLILAIMVHVLHVRILVMVIVVENHVQVIQPVLQAPVSTILVKLVMQQLKVSTVISNLVLIVQIASL